MVSRWGVYGGKWWGVEGGAGQRQSGIRSAVTGAEQPVSRRGVALQLRGFAQFARTTTTFTPGYGVSTEYEYQIAAFIFVSQDDGKQRPQREECASALPTHLVEVPRTAQAAVVVADDQALDRPDVRRLEEERVRLACLGRRVFMYTHKSSRVGRSAKQW